MELSAREKYIAELKEFYKTKGDPALASLKKKYPNGFFPHDTMSLNIIIQIYFNIKLWGFVGGAYYRYTDGGALFIDAFNLLVSLFGF